MAFDGLLAGAVAIDLNRKLQGAKIEKIQQPETDEIIMQLYCPADGKRRRLLLCVSPQGARVHLTQLYKENPKEPPIFCMVLRKHIQGGRIAAVNQVSSDRIIRFDIETISEMGYSTNKCLVCETMGRHSNIILLDSESDKIIDSAKRISIDLNRYRQILPGMPYLPPPGGEKKNYWTLKDGDFEKISEIQGVGRAVAAEFEADPAMIFEVQEDLLAGNFRPAVYIDDRETPFEVHAFPLRKLSESSKVLAFEEIGDALDYYYDNRVETNRLLQRAESFTKSVDRLIDKQLLKKQRLLEEIQMNEKADEYRLKGELLNANLHAVKPGDKSVSVVSYYDGSTVVIELDERFSASKNAQNYYKKYSKAKSGRKINLARLEECKADIEYLESVRDQIEISDSYEELELLKNELVREGYIRPHKTKERKRALSKPKPRRFTLPCGLNLLVGRSNSENDYLSFKLGKKSDYWFHTKDIHGSHALLLTEGEAPGEDAIFQAAAVAAWFSKARNSENVPVDYLPLKYLKKPAGAKPGMVVFTNNRTVWVNPIDPLQWHSGIVNSE
ncbi:MAG: fibronectin/fibrinogen-binding protein [Clostridiales bacterium]|nr:fibronectin/fibrinogen-binding protein [Clostridiales bacterium]